MNTIILAIFVTWQGGMSVEMRAAYATDNDCQAAAIEYAESMPADVDIGCISVDYIAAQAVFSMENGYEFELTTPY